MHARVTQIFFIYSFFISSTNYAYSNVQWGNLGAIGIPATGIATALLMRDYQGIAQMGLSLLMVEGAVTGLKYTTHEQRPNGDCCNSFPSGHTAIAFTGASFINFRYGIKYALPLYAGATFVAASRVQDQSHYVRDVIGGAALGVLGTYLSTTPYTQGVVSLTLDTKFVGIIYKKIFD